MLHEIKYRHFEKIHKINFPSHGVGQILRVIEINYLANNLFAEFFFNRFNRLRGSNIFESFFITTDIDHIKNIE